MKLKTHHKILLGIAAIATTVIVGYHSLAPTTCHSSTIFPDPICTPGAINPNVTQANIGSTICVSGFTKTIRPSVSYTSQLKMTQIKQYGYSDTNPADYEEDHLISLELGGSPIDPKNLWPEPYLTYPNAHDKDKVENLCHTKICSGIISLADAQKQIATNWTIACK